LYLHRERKDGLGLCIESIAQTLDMLTDQYIQQLKEDPVALADRLAAVEIKTETTQF